MTVSFLLNCKLPKSIFRASGPHIWCVDIWGVSNWVQNCLSSLRESCFGSARSHTGGGDEASQSIISRRRNDLRNSGHPRLRPAIQFSLRECSTSGDLQYFWALACVYFSAYVCRFQFLFPGLTRDWKHLGKIHEYEAGQFYFGRVFKCGRLQNVWGFGVIGISL